jgi:hypothetical protein
MKTMVGGLALAVALAGPAGAQVLLYAPEKAIMPAVVLDDQFEHCHTAAALRGDVVVLIYGDNASSAANKALGSELHLAFHPTAQGKPPAEARKAPVRPVRNVPPGTRSPEVLIVQVASVGQLPGVVRSAIRATFRSSSPDLPIWLDFQDQLKEQCGFSPGVPNLAVVDTTGRLRCLATGPLTPAQVARVTAVIESLRSETVLGTR